MLKIFNRVSPVSLLLLFALQISLQFKFLWNAFQVPMRIYPFRGFAFPNSWVNWSYEENFLAWLLAVFMHLAVAIYINHKCIKQKITGKNSFTAALSYSLFSSLLADVFWLAMPIVATLLLIEIIELIFKAGQRSDAIDSILYAGILTGVVVALSPSYLIYVPFLFIILGVQKVIRMQDTVTFTLGILSFLAAIIAIYWVISPSTNHVWGQDWLAIPSEISPKAILPLLLALFFAYMGSYYQRLGNQIRVYTIKKRWSIYHILAVAAFLHCFLNPKVPNAFITEFLLLAAIISSSVFNIVLNKKTATISFIFAIIVIVIQQIVLNK